MIAAALLLALQAIYQVPAAPPEWSVLPPVPYADPPQLTPALSRFVGGEVAAGRCRVAAPVNSRYIVRLDIAALIAADGTIRRAVPRAIGCPTIEQYGVGLVSNFARGNLRLRAGEQWYVAHLVFNWPA